MRVSLTIWRPPAVALLLPLLPVLVFAQQMYVTRFDAYAGYAYLNSPSVGLVEHGFETQSGVRVSRWLSMGFDYSISTGSLTLTPDLLTSSLQQTLAAQFAKLVAAGVIPPTYKLAVPTDSLTQTFAGGPQFSYRRFKKVTLFIRPSFGIIHETATPRPVDPVAAGVVMQLAPSGQKSDNTAFYGVGGGIDYNFSKHVSVRLQADMVRDHLFSDLLQNARNTVRFSVGPAFNFGPNIAK
jgi:hypothetical protein